MSAVNDAEPSAWTIAERAFVAARQPDWIALETIVRRVEVSGVKHLSTADVARLPTIYRRVCADLARATAARYSRPLIDSLGSVTARAHAIVYASSDSAATRGDLPTRLARAVLAFPNAVDRNRGFILLAFILFFAPLVGGLVAAKNDPTFAYHLMPQSELRSLQEAYEQGFDEGRTLGAAAAMTGFYVQHNVGIALRGLALGVIGGVGSAVTLVFNGLAIGAVLGFIIAGGAGENILTFVVGHSAFELGAIVLAGGAGMRLGWAIVAPGTKTRLASVQSVAPDILTIAVGASVMLLCAAGIEGCWSGSSVPSTVKRVVGVVNLTLVLAYFVVGAIVARRRLDERAPR
jgi:uncharacterized membrane protein SpoIIM required for sporulation